jgi:hypothetical protein
MRDRVFGDSKNHDPELYIKRLEKRHNKHVDTMVKELINDLNTWDHERLLEFCKHLRMNDLYMAGRLNIIIAWEDRFHPIEEIK